LIPIFSHKPTSIQHHSVSTRSNPTKHVSINQSIYISHPQLRNPPWNLPISNLHKRHNSLQSPPSRPILSPPTKAIPHILRHANPPSHNNGYHIHHPHNRLGNIFSLLCRFQSPSEFWLCSSSSTSDDVLLWPLKLGCFRPDDYDDDEGEETSGD